MSTYVCGATTCIFLNFCVGGAPQALLQMEKTISRRNKQNSNHPEFCTSAGPEMLESDPDQFTLAIFKHSTKLRRKYSDNS